MFKPCIPGAFNSFRFMILFMLKIIVSVEKVGQEQLLHMDNSLLWGGDK